MDSGRAGRHRICQRPGRIRSGVRLRAKAGHPGPFNLRYMEIGNENGGPDYHQRWALLVNAIRAKISWDATHCDH